MSDHPISSPLLAALREAIDAGETQTALAARCGMTRPKLSNLLNGKGTINLDTADRVAAALGLALTPARGRAR